MWSVEAIDESRRRSEQRWGRELPAIISDLERSWTGNGRWHSSSRHCGSSSRSVVAVVLAMSALRRRRAGRYASRISTSSPCCPTRRRQISARPRRRPRSRACSCASPAIVPRPTDPQLLSVDRGRACLRELLRRRPPGPPAGRLLRGARRPGAHRAELSRLRRRAAAHADLGRGRRRGGRARHARRERARGRSRARDRRAAHDDPHGARRRSPTSAGCRSRCRCSTSRT